MKERLKSKFMIMANTEKADYRNLFWNRKIRFRLLGESLVLICLADILFYRRVVAAFFLMPFGFIWTYVRLDSMRKQRKTKLREDFRETLDAVGTALRAGYSAESAFEEAEAVLRESRGDCDMTREIKTINEGVRLRLPIEVLLDDLARRSDLEDIINFAAVFRAAKRHGGPLAVIMADAAGTISRKIDTEREIRLSIAGKAYEQKLVLLMIPAFILYMQVSSPGFLNILYTTAFGAVFMTACLTAYGAAAFWSRKIMAIEI